MQELTLITALGTNPDLVLELIDFFNGGERFRYNAEAEQIRESFNHRRLTRLYLLSTSDKRVRTALETLNEIVAKEYPEIVIEDISLPFSDLCSGKDDTHLKNIVYQTVYKKVAEGERLIIASAGRKTMTNRLIEAGLMHGCEGYLSITADGRAESDIRFRSESFNVLWIAARQFSEERRANLRQIQEGIGNNFRSLYLLPSAVVEGLRRKKIGSVGGDKKTDVQWLRKLPKADLHCHLGGAFSSELLKELAEVIIEDFALDRKKLVSVLENKLSCKLRELSSRALKGDNEERHCLEIVNDTLAEIEVPRYELIAVLLSCLSEEQVYDLSYDGLTIAEIRDKKLDWYMHCGDLGGSSLLQSRKTLRLALRWLLESAWQDGCLYMEIRCSPGNYVQGGLSIRDVMETLIDEGRQFMAERENFHVNFIIMATRHKAVGALVSHVSAAVVYSQVSEKERQHRSPRVVGFDLAGQEENHDPAQYADLFLPLHHHFINITIHAGEMEKDDKIWQALYLLHAKRIGHGLKLIHNERMMGYVRDYGIAIELCPTSNIQTNNFRLFSENDIEGERYPLKTYLDRGINVTVNTDNMGISQTLISRELHLACELTENGLSRWDVMKLCKNGLRAVFLPKDEKDRLLKEADSIMYQLILDEYFPA